MEAALGQQYLALRQELREAEQDCTQNVCPEARWFLREPEQSTQRGYNTIKLPLLRLSLSAAGRRHHNDALAEQVARWQTALNLVTEGVEEMHNKAQARRETQENILSFSWVSFEMSTTNSEWQDWCEENLPEAEAAVGAGGEEEAATALPAAKAPPAVPAPVTPAVFQNSPLNPAVLAPRSLPYVHFDPNVLPEQLVQLEAQEEWEWREEELQEQTLLFGGSRSTKGSRVPRSLRPD